MLIFPKLLGMSYPVTRRPHFSTIINTAASGLEVRIGNYLYPLSEWDIPFDWLSAEQAQQDFQTLYGMFVRSFGAFAPFLFSDPTDNTTSPNPLVPTPSPIATADGVTAAFQIGRTLGEAYEPVFDINATGGAPKIYLNTILQVGTYTISSTGLVTFFGAPAVGTIVKADFQYYWRVRFLNDDIDFDNFAHDLWNNKKLTLRQVRV